MADILLTVLIWGLIILAVMKAIQWFKSRKAS